MWSVAKRDVSDVPGGCRLPTCQRKSVGGMRRLKRRPFFPVLIADRAGEVRPLRRLGVLRRVQRVEADVAEPARHPDEIRRLHLPGMLEVALGVPVGLVELRIGEAAQSDDAGRVAGDAGHDRLLALVHPQPVLVGRRRGPASRLRDRAERREPAAVQPRVDVGEQVDVALGELRHPHPELLVAAGPEIPGVAASALGVGQIAIGVAVVGFVLAVGRRLRAAALVATDHSHERQQPRRAADRHRRPHGPTHRPPPGLVTRVGFARPGFARPRGLADVDAARAAGMREGPAPATAVTRSLAVDAAGCDA